MPTDPASPPDHPGDDDRAVLEAVIREALRAGPTTAAYADRVRIFFIGSRAVIRGRVDVRERLRRRARGGRAGARHRRGHRRDHAQGRLTRSRDWSTARLSSTAAATGRSSRGVEPGDAGSARNQVAWRLAKATFRRASSSIAASSVSSPSRTAHASR